MSQSLAEMIAPLALKGMKPGEIADRLGVNPDTVRGTMSRLRRGGTPVARHTAWGTPYIEPINRKRSRQCQDHLSSAERQSSNLSKLDGAESSTPQPYPKTSGSAASTCLSGSSQTPSRASETVVCASAPPMPPEMQRRIDRVLERAAGKPELQRAIACWLHYLDLTRAGFKFGHGELSIPNEERGAVMLSRTPPSSSYCGSPAAMCAAG